jgi:ethanolamine permease
MEFGRVGYAPEYLGNIHRKFKTPANALVVNMLIGIVALFTGKTAEIITMACFGALVLYIVSMIAYLQLKKNEPEMERPFKAPMYPFFPATALIIASVALIAMSYYNPVIATVFFALVGLSYLYFIIFLNKKMTS